MLGELATSPGFMQGNLSVPIGDFRRMAMPDPWVAMKISRLKHFAQGMYMPHLTFLHTRFVKMASNLRQVRLLQWRHELPILILMMVSRGRCLRLIFC